MSRRGKKKSSAARNKRRAAKKSGQVIKENTVVSPDKLDLQIIDSSSLPKIKTPLLKEGPVTSKIRLIYYGDSPTASTGFGQVSKNILTGLHATGDYDIKVLGINYWGDPHNFPFPIWPMPVGLGSTNDPFGREKIQNFLMRRKDMEFDLLFILQDTFIMNFLPTFLPSLKNSGKKFRSIYYFPIDGTPKDSWMEAVDTVDKPVVYTQFGYEQCTAIKPKLKKKLSILPHGVNTSDFYPVEKKRVEEWRNTFFKGNAKGFLMVNVNRNQQRKDLPRCVMAFKELRKHVPDSKLYLHCAIQDQGWKMDDTVKALGLTTNDVIMPTNIHPAVGFPINVLNMIYNAADVVVSTTVGEGWGLCIESSAKIPTTSGCKPIKDINKGDKILASRSGWSNVLNTFNREVNNVIKVKAIGSCDTILTPSHPVLSIKFAGNSFSKSTIKEDMARFRKVKYLEKGDLMAFPRNTVFSSDVCIIDIVDILKEAGFWRETFKFDEKSVWSTKSFSSNKHFYNILKERTGETKKVIENAIRFLKGKTKSTSVRSKAVVKFILDEELDIPQPIKIHRFIPLDSEFLYLLGWYLAEGSFSYNNYASEFSLHRKEQDVANYLNSITSSKFGISGLVATVGINKCRLSINSIIFGLVMTALCGKNAHHKIINESILNNKLSLWKIFSGWAEGDGCFKKSGITVTTCSVSLAYQFKRIMAYYGLPISINFVSSRKCYICSLLGKAYERFVNDFETSWPKLDNVRHQSNFIITDNYIFSRIQKLETCNSRKYSVYDIQIDAPEHAFVADGYTVHNSSVEAMATRTCCVFPDNTSLSEIFAEDRGVLVKCGDTPSHFNVIPRDNEVLRPIVNVEDMAEKLLHLYENPEEREAYATRGYDFVVNNWDWQKHIVPMWDKLFKEEYNKLGIKGGRSTQGNSIGGTLI